MREEQRHVEPRHEVKEEDARDEGVVRRDQIKDERHRAGKSLPQGEPMLEEQLVLQKEILRAVAGERLERHAEEQEHAINRVAAPGEIGPFGIEGDHDPDAEPEQRGDENDLAEKEETVKTF